MVAVVPTAKRPRTILRTEIAWREGMLTLELVEVEVDTGCEACVVGD
jgi:hypothetical protein